MEDGFKITLEFGPEQDPFDHKLKGVVDIHIYNLAEQSTNESVAARAKALAALQPLPVFPHLRVEEPLAGIWTEVERAFLIRGEQGMGNGGFPSTESALQVLPLRDKEIRVACYPEAHHLDGELERIKRLHAYGVSTFVTDFVLDISKLEAFLKQIPPVYLVVSLLPGVWENLEKLSTRFPDRKLPKKLPLSEEDFKMQILALLKRYRRMHLQLCSWGDPVKAVSYFRR